MRGPTPSDPSVHAAALAAAALIAHQVAGKATRDALFLSYFDVTGLPWMVVFASLVSILAGIAAAHAMSSVAPGRLIPRAFVASAVLLLLEWLLSQWSDSLAAVMIYLQMAALGSALISGFWSLLDDRFDLHTARKQFGRIVAAGTFGGLAGGILAERIGTGFGVTAMLPVLAVLHLLCAWLTSGRLSATAPPRANPKARNAVLPAPSDPDSIKRSENYLRHIALLIVLTTIGAGLLDYAFKAYAAAAYRPGGELVRFFALFYTATGLITFITQVTLSRPALEKVGLARTVSTLPWTVALGSIGSLLIPGLAGATAARGSEAVLRSSLFRSGYELLYAAVPRRDRRATKPIVDIGFERLGDTLGGLLVSLLLLAGAAAAIPLMLMSAALTGLAGVWISSRLHAGYVQALETTLLNHSIHLDIDDIRSTRVRSVAMQSLGNLAVQGETQANHAPVPHAFVESSAADPLMKRIRDLRSSDPAIVRRALAQPLDTALTPHVIALLAWDIVADDTVKALQKVANGIIGQLTDAMLDPKQEFAIRRRIPRVLSVCNSQRAFDGLAQALFDRRFEVRFEAGRALAQIQDRIPDVEVSQYLIVTAVLLELDVEREVWDSRRVIDAPRDGETASVSLEHVFRLLSLVLPRIPLKAAYRSLHSGDEHLKGTALEYLDTVLPLQVREGFWNHVVRAGA